MNRSELLDTATLFPRGKQTGAAGRRAGLSTRDGEETPAAQVTPFNPERQTNEPAGSPHKGFVTLRESEEKSVGLL